MTDYSDHQEVMDTLKDDQHAEYDLREQISEIISFLHDSDGQWEPRIWAQTEGRPRYTFDQMKPMIAKAWAEMAANEYTATTMPVGGGADEVVSDIIDGLIRNINDISSYDDITTKSGKRMIGTGFGAWRVVSKFVGESFYQDIVILPISDCHERVWFDANSELQTREDANHVFVLQGIGLTTAKRRWPKRDGVFLSVDDSQTTDRHTYKPKDKINVGEILYKKPIKKTIYLLNDEESSVLDDKGLEQRGLSPDSPEIEDFREIDAHEVWSRKFDGKDWLEKEKKTAFKHLPVIAEYANFDVSEGKVTYEGLVRPLMDHQRVFNYVESRKVEESILASRGKTWVDDRLAEGYADELSDINRNPAEVQLFNGKAIAEGAPPPFKTPGPQINPALTELSNDMVRNMQLTAGLPNELAVMQNTVRDSNERFDRRSSQGQLGTFEYYRAHKVALEHTAKVLLGAIPVVYDTQRKIRTIAENGQSSEVMINENRNGEMINSLTLGKYDITVKVGANFEDRQTEANTRILELADRVPGVAERNSDIIASNIDSPGMNVVTDRERAFLMNQGVIPQDEWTDEEIEAARQAQQPPDPATVIAQAEMQKAQAQALTEQAKLEQQQNKQDFDQTMQIFQAEQKAQSQAIQDMNAMIKGLVDLNSIDADNAARQQAELIDDSQDKIDNNSQ